jgi:hypothetical protein
MKNKEFKIGKETEKNFKKLFLETIDATKEQDIKEHWDIKVLLDEKEVKIDVKSIKKLNRYDVVYNENFHWVELKNVNGDHGWLYGDSDLIAFEIEEYFILVGRLKLKKFIESKVKDQEITNSKTIYTKYQRKGRKDIIVLVKTIDLMILSYDIIKKV